ncbi:hypothetical protein Sta7437_0492 [Stanieria cyanosphaera PCC 7437]|uniref:Uncharacterized protein n=1 Tax=Stanieria cyanosphaera (strain ATCC 29371 / PCC 7437) TaxID=111780 RepID=K9XPT8_STAC7|nr:hypothetical protein [Stanieria cyanosphaera]AFZ34099.1 hypothetical protein Sta7437_0492 [Stanieria cyanosphaera PCC 7437]
MTTITALDRFWSLVAGVLTLNSETFQLLNHLPLSLIASILVVLLAALSQGIGQSVVLFINRVRPIRFILSLAIAAVLFTFNYNFWVLSTWLVATQLFHASLSLIEVIQTFGFSYAPLLLGFLMVIPYFGMPIFVILSIWTLLAIVTGIDAIANLGLWQVFECCIGGWIVLQVSQRLLGRPIEIITNWLMEKIAGVDLITDQLELEQILYTGLPIAPAPTNIPNFFGDLEEN